MESFKLNQWFEINQIVYDDGTYQNKIAMFEKAADYLGVKMTDILVFEDSFSGIANAYAVGCRQIIVICPNNQRVLYENLPGVLKTIETFEDSEIKRLTLS